MKTLHYRWNRSLNWILTTLLGFLGFSSCEDNGDDPGNIICMYGTPTASYTIKGKVTDQAGQALSDIQIIVSDMEFSYEPRPDFIPIDTVKYNLKINPDENNPYYQADSLKVTFLRKDLQGGEGWNRGNTTQEVKIILTPQKEEDHE